MEEFPELITEISAVNIYRDGARIERTGTILLKPGSHKIRISNLTRYLDKESVRVSGRGNASIVSFDTVDTTVEATGYSQLDNLVKKKEDLEKQKAQIQREIARLQQRAAFFSQVMEKSASEFSRWIPAGECEVDRISSLEGLVTTQIEKLEKDQLKVQEKLEAVDKELAITNREIEKLRSGVRQYEITNTILINVEASKAGNCDFNITYFVKRAAWAPTYDFDLSEATAKVTMYTVVRNNTLEDWKNVRLTVSTASSRPATVTEPSPYLIRVYTPPPPSMSVRAAKAGLKRRDIATSGAPMEAKEELDASMDILAEDERPAGAPPPEMVETTATVMEVGGVHVYALPEPVDVPADGEPHSFRTSHTKLDSEQKYFWNAVDFSEAIEVTTIENADTIILPGKARIYSADDYLGETLLKVIAPHEKVDVGTRFTYDIKVEKKLVAKGAEKTGLTRGNVAREYQYELLIKNFRKKPSLIKVMDRIPHSDSEIIKVEDRKFSQKPK
ncbi:MAG: mucoidy inhibitor MuiA family protein, partial [Promethearchaeota archaeon]